MNNGKENGEDSISVNFSHFEWINKEIIRLKSEVLRLVEENDKLKLKISDMENAIISGGAVISDAVPYNDNSSIKTKTK